MADASHLVPFGRCEPQLSQSRVKAPPCLGDGLNAFRCITLVQENGLRIPMLVDGEGLPVPLPLRWVIWERLGRLATQTIIGDMRAVSLLYQYSRLHGIELENRLSVAAVFSIAEIKGFARWLRCRKEGQTLGRETYNNYLGRVGAYAGWATGRSHAYSTDIEQARFAAKAGEEIRRLFTSEKVTGKSRKEHLGLTKEETTKLLELIEPTNERNPFAKDTAFANMVMFRFLLETGMRQGELRAARVDDLTINGNEALIRIVDRPDPEDDPRRVAPAVKTLERIIPLSPGMARLLAKYERTTRRGARHSFLFVAPRFKTPISPGQVNHVFAVLKKRGNLLDLTPHTLRRTFNDRLRETARLIGLNREETKQLQTWICGWDEQSQMPQLYAKREIRERAWELLRQLQQGYYK